MSRWRRTYHQSLKDALALYQKGNFYMPRLHQSDEVRILRFFEEEPLEKAELLFRIVENKMRKRMPPGRLTPKKKDMRAPKRPGEGAKDEEVRDL